MAHRSTEFPHPWCRSTHCHLERPGWCRYARNVMSAERCFSSTSSFANFVRRWGTSRSIGRYCASLPSPLHRLLMLGSSRLLSRLNGRHLWVCDSTRLILYMS
jgi:hypothetical protein